MSEEGILAAIRVENQSRCVPPLNDGVLCKTAASVAKYAPAQMPVLELTQIAFADLIGMTSRTLQSMESGSRPITRLQQLALNWLALQGKVKP
jgi:hypothetical protein